MFKPVAELAQLVRSGDISARELVELHDELAAGRLIECG